MGHYTKSVFGTFFGSASYGNCFLAASFGWDCCLCMHRR